MTELKNLRLAGLALFFVILGWLFSLYLLLFGYEPTDPTFWLFILFFGFACAGASVVIVLERRSTAVCTPSPPENERSES